MRHGKKQKSSLYKTESRILIFVLYRSWFLKNWIIFISLY